MTSPRGFTRWAVAHSQALGLSFLLALVAAVVIWFFAFFIPGQRQAAVGAWRRDLSVIADTRRDLLDRRISDGLANASFVATFPSVRALVSSAPHESSDEGSVSHINAILSNFRNVYGERSISIRNAEGAAVASSDGPGPGADAVALAREAAHSGKSRIDLVHEPDGFIAFVVAAPVRESRQNEETGGTVLIVGNAKEKAFDILLQPFTAGTGEAVLVRRDGDSALYLSPLRFRPDPPLTFRHALNVPGFTARGALEGDFFGSFVDYHGAKVFAAGRMLKRAPWGLVVKVDEGEALARFRNDVFRRGLTWGGLLLALTAAVVGIWRSLVTANEVKLARSEARFGALVEQATDAIFLFGNDGRVLQANRAAEVMYGWTRDELLSIHATDVSASGTRDALRHDMETAAARGNLLVETRHRRADGSEFPVEVNTGLVKVGDETLFLSIVRDITERKRAEANVNRLNAELEEALAWQRQIFEGSRDAVFVSDEQARFVAVNGAATELTGYSHEELLAMGIPDLHDEPDLAAYRAFHQRILGGEQILSEAPIRKKGGSKVVVEFNNRLVTVGGRRFMHTAGRDITERLQLEAQLRQAQKMEAVGRLAGGVAHDFNNLLTVIQGHAELLGASLANDPERSESMGEIVRAAERAAALTRQLLAFSRRQVLETRVLDLGEVVAGLEKMLRRLIGEDIEVVVVKPATLGRVKADPGQIEQVLLNLAVNSRDAMPGGGRLTVELADVNLDAPLTTSHDSIPSGRYVVVLVRDTGGGMDAETLGHLFEPFFTTKEKGKGTGLGLATVFGIVKQSGGYMDVASTPGAGTTFRVYLPRSVARTTSGVRPRGSSRSGSETVLLVEDEAAVRNLVRAILERKGYVVLAAQDGAAALDLVEKHSGVIHVLLTDVVMPGMNGRDLAARVKARRPTIKVVFMSGYTADVPADFGSEGGPAFLSKPFNERALTVKLREVLDTPPA